MSGAPSLVQKRQQVSSLYSPLMKGTANPALFGNMNKDDKYS
jgi:hypothetical protein